MSALSIPYFLSSFYFLQGYLNFLRLLSSLGSFPAESHSFQETVFGKKMLGMDSKFRKINNIRGAWNLRC